MTPASKIFCLLLAACLLQPAAAAAQGYGGLIADDGDSRPAAAAPDAGGYGGLIAGDPAAARGKAIDNKPVAGFYGAISAGTPAAETGSAAARAAEARRAATLERQRQSEEIARQNSERTAAQNAALEKRLGAKLDALRKKYAGAIEQQRKDMAK